MELPLTVIVDFFMEQFEENRPRTAQYKPKYWFRYIDDTVIVCPHGTEILFQKHLDYFHDKIRFTMEKKDDRVLPFLDRQKKRFFVTGF